MGWREEGDCLVLPPGKSLTMREVRDIDDALVALKKRQEEEFKQRIAARNKAMDPEKARLVAEMKADRAEQKARGPVTQGSVAVPKGNGNFQTASAAGCCGTSGG